MCSIVGVRRCGARWSWPNFRIARKGRQPCSLSGLKIPSDSQVRPPHWGFAVTEWKTAEQVHQDYLAAMGQELGELFYALDNEVTWLHLQWRQFRVLYGDKESRIDLLNEAAPHFFRVVQDVLFDDTLLSIARLTGSVESVGRPNLSIRRLPRLVEPDRRGPLEQLVESAIEAAAFANDWRNRRLAHRDLALAIDAPATPLAPASRQGVENALRALRSVLNYVHEVFRNSITAYEHSHVIGDAEELLYVIRDGLRHRKDQLERFSRHELLPEDLKAPEAV